MKNQKQPMVAVSKIREIMYSKHENNVVFDKINLLINEAEADFEKNKLKEPQEYTFDEFCALKPKQRKRSNMLIHSRIILETDGSAKNLQYWLSDFGKWHKSLDFTALKDLQYRIDPDYKVEAEPKPVEKPEPSYAERQAAWVKENDVNIGDKVKVLRKALKDLQYRIAPDYKAEAEPKPVEKPEPSYAERQAAWIEENSVKVGDKFKVLRKAEDYEQGWGIDWADKMDYLVNKIIKIDEIDTSLGTNNGLHSTNNWYFPYFVLEKVEVSKYRPFTLETLQFERPIRLKTQPKSKRRISFADEKGVYIYILSGDKLTYEQALEELEFADECEDRTFGVRL